MLIFRRRFVVACGCLALFAPQMFTPKEIHASAVTLTWTAPGDDGLQGNASAYIVRYSTAPLVAPTFPNATLVTGVPRPKPAGVKETLRVTGLSPGQRYYFGIIVTDDGGNWSQLSNIVSTAATTGVGDVPLNFEFAAPRPNPARHSTHIAFAMPEGAFAQVEVFDVAGRFQRTLVRGWRDAGRTELEWDLNDDSGRPVAAGVYIVRARLGASSWTKRLVVTK